MKVAAEIERIRIDRGLTQVQLAAMAKVSRSKLNEVINHASADLNVSTLTRIADALGCDVRLIPRKK